MATGENGRIGPSRIRQVYVSYHYSFQRRGEVPGPLYQGKGSEIYCTQQCEADASRLLLLLFRRYRSLDNAPDGDSVGKLKTTFFDVQVITSETSPKPAMKVAPVSKVQTPITQPILSESASYQRHRQARPSDKETQLAVDFSK